MGVSNLTIYCPSQWLCEICKDSFFSCYPIELKRNNIDLSCFVPRKENCFEKYGLSAKKIVLGVASAWSSSKGLYDFYKLADMLDDDYKIVLVGLSRKQIGRLPKNIFGIERTSSKEELSMIYSSSFVFVNPTYEDTYPTVNIEAQACGTPVITYRTGGSPESVPEENCVEAGNIEEIKRKIVELSIKRGVKTCGQG